MGEVELQSENNLLIIHSVTYFYGDVANETISAQVAKDVADHWNEPNGKVVIKRTQYSVFFDINGVYQNDLIPEMVFENTNPRNNYFRIEEYARGNISFVEGGGVKTLDVKLENLLNNF